VFVLVSAELVMMCPVIYDPASCEIRLGVHFLHAKNMSAAEIYAQFMARMFKDGRTNIHDEEQSGWPSVVSDDDVQSVNQKSL
jgi:hypothetical protein